MGGGGFAGGLFLSTAKKAESPRVGENNERGVLDLDCVCVCVCSY